MKDSHRAHERELMVEAFRAGWQAALAVRVTHPRVLAVIDSCFEQWLEEAADEIVVLGLPFRRRDDLPAHPASHPAAKPTGSPKPARARPAPAAAFIGLGAGPGAVRGAVRGAGAGPGLTQQVG